MAWQCCVALLGIEYILNEEAPEWNIHNVPYKETKSPISDRRRHKQFRQWVTKLLIQVHEEYSRNSCLLERTVAGLAGQNQHARTTHILLDPHCQWHALARIFHTDRSKHCTPTTNPSHFINILCLVVPRHTKVFFYISLVYLFSLWGMGGGAFPSSAH